MPAKKTKKTAKKKTAKKTAKKVVAQKVSKNMTLSEVVSKYPATIDVFLSHGMGCFGCGVAQFETIAQGAQAHGINLKRLLEDLNKAVNKK